jgi:hypothetical protein
MREIDELVWISVAPFGSENLGIKPKCSAGASGQMTPEQFVEKWSRSDLSERAASQEHFIDLCRLIGEPISAMENGREHFRSHAHLSKSQEGAVKRYIAGQRKHHKKEDFKSELLRLLGAHGIEFDEKYIFIRSSACRIIPPPPRRGLVGFVGLRLSASTGCAALHPWLHSFAPLRH